MNRIDQALTDLLELANTPTPEDSYESDLKERDMLMHILLDVGKVLFLDKEESTISDDVWMKVSLHLRTMVISTFVAERFRDVDQKIKARRRREGMI